VLGGVHEGTRYNKGIDMGGAILSTSGVALLTYSLAYVFFFLLLEQHT
jgi:hypothetical protein